MAPATSNDPLSVEIFRRWKAVIAWGVAGLVAGVALSFLITKAYRAEVVVMPASDRDMRTSLADSLGALSNFASLAGVNLSGAGAREEDMEYVKSNELLRRFVVRHNVKPVLFAKRYDAKTKSWIGDEPTLGAAVAKLKNGIVTILPDRRSGAIRVSVVMTDRMIAAQWANALIADANADLRESAQRNAEKSIEFLRNELQKTTIIGVEQAIHRLIETQINRIMVANVSADYAFKVVDPAVAADADRPVRPNRILMGLIGGFLAAGAYLAVILLKFAQRRLLTS
jgi:uncharacterized protein involved in exopolysaccharide biosynthesis